MITTECLDLETSQSKVSLAPRPFQLNCVQGGFGNFYPCISWSSSPNLVGHRKREGRKTLRQGASSKKTELMGGSFNLKLQVLILGPRVTPRDTRHGRQNCRSILNSSFLCIVPSYKTCCTILYHQCGARPETGCTWGLCSAPRANFVTSPSLRCPSDKLFETRGFSSSGFLTYYGRLRT